MEQQLALLILGDLDPYPPELTRRASPPPEVRRARLVITLSSLTTRESSSPTAVPISKDEIPVLISVTDDHLPDAARYEQHMRELMSWSESVTD